MLFRQKLYLRLISISRLLKRRTLLSILIGLCLHWPIYAQDPNPQNSFANTENYANPSLYLNFNDQTTAFKDQISGLSFVNTEQVTSSTVSGTLITPTRDDTGSNGDLFWNNIALTTGYLTSVSVRWHTAPSVGQTITFLIGSAPSSGNITVEAYFTVTMAATTAVQTFNAPADFTAVAVTAGEVLGEWSATGLQGSKASGGSGLYYGSAQRLPQAFRRERLQTDMPAHPRRPIAAQSALIPIPHIPLPPAPSRCASRASTARWPTTLPPSFRGMDGARPRTIRWNRRWSGTRPGR